MKKKILIFALALAVAGVAMGAIAAYRNLLCKMPKAKNAWIYVYPNTTSADVLQQIETTTQLQKFWIEVAASIEGLQERVDNGKTCGAYKLQEGENLITIVRNIKLRRQTPVRFTFNNIRLKEDLAGRVASYLMMDSTSLYSALCDTTLLKGCDMDSLNIESLFLPDTYEVYWDISPKNLVARMHSEYDKFWNNDRRHKAEELGITPREASIIASIAEEETQGKAERGVVARLYLNRLRRGMLLQADPTVKYAIGDFSLKRILKTHLETDSPFNTYKYAGLPPGPIRIPEKATIDALLNSKPHPYIYMCAKEDFSGSHNFARTLDEHYRNAAKYHKALNALAKSQSE